MNGRDERNDVAVVTTVKAVTTKSAFPKVSDPQLSG